ncbi:MAG: cysteine--tRNA ligase [Deltaproteobacteria bacterium]|nr:MAG: cysteine--tRNA ligase [Deltaproteobacteria bacterium]
MTPIRLYDSLRKQKVPFEPREPGKVSMYLCGPTTYDSAHLGHARSAISFDLVRRAFRFLGYEVTFVRNITDVDDKIIQRANERGEDPVALARRYADEYNRDMAMLGVLPPDVEPRVSEHIEPIIQLIQRLVDAGKAYAVDGDVYFAVDTFPSYGQLSGQSIDDLRAGARVEVDQRKRAPVDFALWKAAKPGEPAWDSPWGKGRPGWHIECSAMTWKHLGEAFDVHGGGKDLVFPHHENEIAQSQGAFGPASFARYWMHNGFVNLNDEKMSKSLGNFFSIAEVIRHHDPEAVRLFLLSHHIRSPINLEVVDRDGEPAFPDLEQAERRLEYFYTTLKRLDAFNRAAPDPGDGPVVDGADALVPEVRAALADDFNAPVAIAALGEAARLANKLLDEGKGGPKDVRRRSLRRLAADIRSVANDALGLLSRDPDAFLTARRDRLASKRGIDVQAVERLVAERAEARKRKDFAAADELRDRLAHMGVEVLDTPAGAEWRVAD